MSFQTFIPGGVKEFLRVPDFLDEVNLFVISPFRGIISFGTISNLLESSVKFYHYGEMYYYYLSDNNYEMEFGNKEFVQSLSGLLLKIIVSDYFFETFMKITKNICKILRKFQLLYREYYENVYSGLENVGWSPEYYQYLAIAENEFPTKPLVVEMSIYWTLYKIVDYLIDVGNSPNWGMIENELWFLGNLGTSFLLDLFYLIIAEQTTVLNILIYNTFFHKKI